MTETVPDTAEGQAAPDAPKREPAAVETAIQAVLDEIRPALHFDGGDCDFLDYSPETGVVRIQMVGACHGCSMSEVTLTSGIERIMKERVPEVSHLVNVPPEYEPTNPKY